MNDQRNIQADSVPRFSRGVRLRHDAVRDEWVLLAPERLFKADAIAAEILKSCDGTTSLAGLVDSLAAKYNIEREIIERDVKALLQGLIDKRMIDI